MTRTYRATVRGRFVNLDVTQKQALRSAQQDHDMFTARFTPEGTFLYTSELLSYQHRFEISVAEESPEDADTLAAMRAQELAEADLNHRGLHGKLIDVSCDCIEDMKLRRRATR